MPKAVLVIAALILGSWAFAQETDSTSLGDVARQTRQQKESKTKNADGAKAPKVITNEDMPSPAATSTAVGKNTADENPANTSESGRGKLPPAEWASRIQAQKRQISGLQSDIDQLNKSIQFAPGNCVQNCEQWNQRQREKQQQVDSMKTQLDEAKKHLEDMQEAARQQGYGSSIYDP